MKKRSQKIIPLFFLSLLIITRSEAQQTDSKIFVDVSVGASLPVGKFGDKEMVNHSTPPKAFEGHATTGPAATITFGYQLKKSVGVTLSIAGITNKLSKKTYADYYQREPEDIHLNADNWNIIRIMAGAFYAFRISGNDKLLIKPTLQGGICKSKIPGVTVTQANSNSPMLMSPAQDLESALCYQVGAQANYPISTKAYLLGDINFFSSSSAKSTRRDAMPFPDKRAYRFSSVNMLIGVGYRF